MRLNYTFPNIPHLKDFSFEVENINDKLRTTVRGGWGFKALLSGPFLKLYFAYFNRNDVKPVMLRQDGNIYSLYVPPIPSQAHVHHMETVLRNWLFKETRPLAVTLAVTSRCQLNCVHCSAASAGPVGSDLSREEIGRIIRESVDLGVTNITFTGGEPLLRKDLEEMVSDVSEEEAVALVFTNALALDERRAASLKEAGLTAVFISLDSPDPEEHDRLRGRSGLFQTVREGVRNAIRAGLAVCLSTYATNESVRDKKLSKLTALAAEWGVHEISVFDVIPTGQLIQNEEFLLTAESHRAICKEAKELNRRYAGRLRIVTQSWTNTRNGMAILIGCLAGHLQFHITPDGEFTPCDFTPLSFGNVRSESIENLWRKVIEHSAYKRHCTKCRMQTASFREKYIRPIPVNANLPYSIATIDGLFDCRNQTMKNTGNQTS
ncbi:MAG: radical SAM protein [Deltaproteobacteria bacterium]|nr:radical SAM protein [Deltaproteobacteria bacterium]